MKNFIFLFLMIFTYSVQSQNPLKLAKSILPEKGSIENEKKIKFNFQQHFLSDTITEYSIVFFEGIKSERETSKVEFWGHGEKYLSIFGEKQINLSGEEIVDFVRSVEKNYNYFISEIVQRMRFSVQSDITVVENVIFTCSMELQGQNLAFWIFGEKYSIQEKELLSLLIKIRMYFNEDWSGIDNANFNLVRGKKTEKPGLNSSTKELASDKGVIIEMDSVYGIYFNSIEKNAYYIENTLYFNDSLFDGKIFWKYKNGHFEKRGLVVSGKNDGIWEYFHKNGNLKEKGNFIKGKQDGLWEYYYEDGTLLGKVIYKYGSWDGAYKTYYKNGQIKEEGNYKQNQKVGDWKYFDESGLQLSEEEYKHRKL